MKKFILTILVTMMMFIALPSVNAKEKLPEVTHDPINVYIFRGDTCGYCHSALEFFEEAQEKYGDYFNLIGYEVSDENNQAFWQKVGAYFNDEVGSIPYIVIGDAYHDTGYAEELEKDIINAILAEYQNKEYVDVVNNLLVENKLNDKVKYEQSSEFTVLQDAQIIETDEKSSSDVYIIIGIFVVLIGGIAGLVIASRKSN